VRGWHAGLLAIAGAGWLVAAAGAAERAPRAPETGERAGMAEITEPMQEAIGRGLRYLAEAQQEDGSFGSDRYGRHVGITALACMAFMADGHLPGRGRWGPVVAGGLDFVLESAQETGLIAAETSHGPMYGHGFATLFLAESLGQVQDPRIREALRKAVRLIVDTQNEEGGWRYHPVPVDADISVTITQVMALRAARNAGIAVPRSTVERAVDYVRRCQDPSSGGFRYMLRSGGPAFPRTAAGIATLYYAGVYEDEAIEEGLDYMMQYRPGAGRRVSNHYYYGHYYAAQAAFLAGGSYWAQWFPAAREQLLARQGADGAWQAGAGRAYGTAMALLVLQVPSRYLPIFER